MNNNGSKETIIIEFKQMVKNVNLIIDDNFIKKSSCKSLFYHFTLMFGNQMYISLSFCLLELENLEKEL